MNREEQQYYDEQFIKQREPLWRSALEELLYQDRLGRLKREYERGGGVWVDEFGPLTAQERTAVLAEWKRIHRVHDPDRR